MDESEELSPLDGAIRGGWGVGICVKASMSLRRAQVCRKIAADGGIRRFYEETITFEARISCESDVRSLSVGGPGVGVVPKRKHAQPQGAVGAECFVELHPALAMMGAKEVEETREEGFCPREDLSSESEFANQTLQSFEGA